MVISILISLWYHKFIIFKIKYPSNSPSKLGSSVKSMTTYPLARDRTMHRSSFLPYPQCYIYDHQVLFILLLPKSLRGPLSSLNPYDWYLHFDTSFVKNPYSTLSVFFANYTVIFPSMSCLLCPLAQLFLRRKLHPKPPWHVSYGITTTSVHPSCLLVVPH